MSEDEKKVAISIEEKKLSLKEQLAQQLAGQPVPLIEEECEVAMQYPEDPIWKKIVEDYKKKFPDAECDGKTLVFPTRNDAVQFFNNFALNGDPFHATFVVNGVLQDDHLFSCGDGQLYKGTYAAIQQSLEANLKTQTDPELKAKILSGIEHIKAQTATLNPASNMRNKLQTSKEEEQENSASNMFGKR